MATYRVRVSQVVEVKLDDEKFTREFFEEFRRSMYPFKYLSEHAEHLAQLHARGICENGSFIEGYGNAKDMGIKFEIERNCTETEVL